MYVLCLVRIFYGLCIYTCMCVPETGRGRVFPDYNSNAAMCSLRNGDSYFGNELNFDAIPQMILTGAA